MSKETRPKPRKPAWKAARPGSATARQDAKDELVTVVVFDIPSNKVRRKVGEICKDYGLSRLQWSAFEGALTRNRREELWARLLELVSKAGDGGRLAMFPIGSREAAWASRWASGPSEDSQAAEVSARSKASDDRAPDK